jgi:signal peptidase II
MLKWLWLSVLVIVLDQISKLAIASHFELCGNVPIEFCDQVEITSFFHLLYVQNTGAAFSLLSKAGGWQRFFFVGLSATASIAITYWLTQLPKHRHWEAAAWALVLGGAIGNLIDRIAYGYVIDFLDVFWPGSNLPHFPAFNVADSAITVGVGILLIDAVIAARQDKSSV